MGFNRIVFCLSAVILLVPCSTVNAQPEEKARRVIVYSGIQHITLLDEQATPVVHEAAGPELTLAFERQTIKHLLQFELNGGMLRFQPSDPELRFYDPALTGVSAGINLTYLYLVKKYEKSVLMAGGSIREEVLVDFEGIGNWPWALAQGGIYINGKFDYQIAPKHKAGVGVSVPVFPWITDLPYNQIPRIEGRAPDVNSLFRVGTRLPFWHNYQRFDIRLMYNYDFHNKWNLRFVYDWAWYHDAVPRDLWSYQGTFNVGIMRYW